MKWNRGPIIGRGSFATVSIATSSTSHKTLAVKSTQLSTSQFLQNEQTILSTLNSPHIVGYKGFDVTTENNVQFYNLFLEYAPAGTLLDTIQKHGGRLPDSMIRSYTKSILLGLHYLHNNGIVHCDLKAQNILVDTYGEAKIADFGCAKWVRGEKENRQVYGGTPLFMAPEVARGEHQGFPADVWALGCTLIQMATGKAPWTGCLHPISALYEIGFSDNVPQVPMLMSEEGKDFLSKCLDKDPINRWPVSQLLNHDFVRRHSNHRTLVVGVDSGADTPTSVLSQSIWESTWDISSCRDSPIERILGLTNVELPNWEWGDDDDWVTVRSYNTGQLVASDKCMEDPVVIVTQNISACVMDTVRWSNEDYNFARCTNSKAIKIGGNTSDSHLYCSCRQLLLSCMVVSWCNDYVASNQLVELIFSSLKLLYFLSL